MPHKDPRCNTCFAKVKFKLKNTQLETIFSSRPEGNYSGAVVLGGFLRGNRTTGSCARGDYSEAIVRGRKHGGQSSAGSFHGGIIPG